ncbi:unnamed protein product [Auanema sp. JU1783]|nr:unnamed protein product [Auanema sp. JU1783]
MTRRAVGHILHPVLDQDQVGVSINVSPNYAILKLKADTNCIQLLQHAFSLGVADISFVSHPKEYFHSTEWFEKRAVYSPDEAFSQIEKSPHSRINDSPPSTGTIEVQTIARDEYSSNSSSNGSRISSSSCTNDCNQNTSLSSSTPDLNNMINTLFGAKNEFVNVVECSNTSPSPTPVIPGNGQVVCKLCGIAVSCRKITNLLTHALKLHCPIGLWRCPLEGCTFDHADHGRVRSHLRHQHPGNDSNPVDNRSIESVKKAEQYLKRCYPAVDFENQYKDVLYLTEPINGCAEKHKDSFAIWDQLSFEEPNTNVECRACRSSIPLKKSALEDHIRQNHKCEKLYQCSLCEYLNADEWKIRVHSSMRHPDKSVSSTLLHLQHKNRIPVLARKLFSSVSDKMPPDEVEVMINSFQLSGGSSLATIPISDLLTDAITKCVTDENSVVPLLNCKDSIASSPLLPLIESQEFAVSGDTNTVQNMLLQMFPSMENPSAGSNGVLRKSSSTSLNRLERIVGKVECKMCSSSVETKRTMLVSHAKSHCTQRQWQCPHCETSAAFHSKLKLHIVNAHKSDAEPIDLYSPSLENKWLLLFRQCFPQFSQQCFVEEWKFRSKQQQHYVTQLEEPMSRNILEGCEQPRRSLLIEDDPPPLDELTVVNSPALQLKLA